MRRLLVYLALTLGACLGLVSLGAPRASACPFCSEPMLTLAEQFAKAYQAKYGYAPDYHAASAAADVETYAKAITAAGSLDPKKVRDAIAKVDFESLYAHVKYGENGQIVLPQGYLAASYAAVRAAGTPGFVVGRPACCRTSSRVSRKSHNRCWVRWLSDSRWCCWSTCGCWRIPPLRW